MIRVMKFHTTCTQRRIIHELYASYHKRTYSTRFTAWNGLVSARNCEETRASSFHHCERVETKQEGKLLRRGSTRSLPKASKRTGIQRKINPCSRQIYRTKVRDVLVA